jgi:hypothetical protein
MPTSISGINIMMRCWAGSIVLGVIFCITNIDTPIKSGVMNSGSFCERSEIHRKSAPRRSIETSSTR